MMPYRGQVPNVFVNEVPLIYEHWLEHELRGRVTYVGRILES